MLNGAVYRQGLRASWKPLVIFLAVLTMYDAVIVSMFDPRIGDLLATLMQTMPDIMAMFGMNNPGATLAEFLANYLYGFLMLIFPLVFSAMTANSLVARHVDRGSMAYLLAAPNSRTRVAFTQMTVLLTGVTAIIAVCTAVGWGCSAAMFPGALDVAGYLRLNLGVWLLHLCLSGLCFFASCISNTTRLSLALGAGTATVFYLIQMLANMGGKLETLRYITLFTLFQPDKLLAGEAAGWVFAAVLGLLGTALYVAGILLFHRRDLPI